MINIFLKKSWYVFILMFTLFITQPGTINSQVILNGNNGQSNQDADGTYTLLAPITNDLTVFDVSSNPSCPLAEYLGVIINIFLGIVAVLAMLMIVIGGIEYMGSELVSSKQAAKQKILNAILGLLIALGAYLILETINPDLLNVCLDLPKQEEPLVIPSNP